MTRRFALILAMVAIFALALPASALVKTGTDLPALSLPGLDGKGHNLSVLTKGKVTVLIYWSLSCPVCRKRMPDFLALNNRLKGNPFAMIMINGDGPAMKPATQGYADKYAMPQPILLDTGPGDSMPLADKLDVIATPTVLVYDAGGKLVFAQELEIDPAKLNQAVEKALMH
jgi:thiol-disulfide isomerase/thioredoxin